MVAQARFSTILVLLCLAVLFLQSGCKVSDDAGDPGDGGPSDGIRLQIATPGDVRAIVANGQDSIPIQVTITDNAGNGTAGVAAIPGIRVIDEPRKGLVIARETGRLASTGDVLVYVDADCRAPSDWLERVAREFAGPNPPAARRRAEHPDQHLWSG